MSRILFDGREIRPGKIVCVGRNQAEHAPELDNPLPAEPVFGLEDGDVIMTGTPAGVGELLPGARMSGRVFDGERLLIETGWSVG